MALAIDVITTPELEAAAPGIGKIAHRLANRLNELPPADLEAILETILLALTAEEGPIPPSQA